LEPAMLLCVKLDTLSTSLTNAFAFVGKLRRNIRRIRALRTEPVLNIVFIFDVSRILRNQGSSRSRKYKSNKLK